MENFEDFLLWSHFEGPFSIVQNWTTDKADKYRPSISLACSAARAPCVGLAGVIAPFLKSAPKLSYVIQHEIDGEQQTQAKEIQENEV